MTLVLDRDLSFRFPLLSGEDVRAVQQALIRAGIDNAVGWDGSVYDADAIRFAEVFYEQLAARRSVAIVAS